MGLLGNIFKGKSSSGSDDKNLPWLLLTEEEQLKQIKEASKAKPQLIFKHSTRCGISRMVLSQFEKEFSLTEKEIDIYYLDLLNYRTISNTIAAVFELVHQSPQVLIIKNEVLIAHDSHSGINSLNYERYL